MKLSIIIPVYNSEKYIKRCLDSIIKDVDSDVEILIIDDGSTDNSLQICKQYQSNCIRVYTQPNSGVSNARNKGIRLALGEYIMFVDSDDCLISNWYNSVRCNMSSNCDIIYFSNCYDNLSLTRNQIVKGIFALPQVGIRTHLSSVWSKIYKRQFIVNNGIKFDDRIINGEDLLFSLETFLLAETYKFVNKSIYNYYIISSSSTHRFNEKFWMSNIIFLQSAEKILINNNVASDLIHECIQYSWISSLYLLLIRISFIKNSDYRNSKLKIFDDDFIRQNITKYKISMFKYGIVSIVYVLISKRLYSLAFLLLKIVSSKNVTRNNYFVQI